LDSRGRKNKAAGQGSGDASPALRLNQDTENAVLVIEIPPGVHFIERMHAATISGIVRMGCIVIPVYAKFINEISVKLYRRRRAIRLLKSTKS
jgi:hypothetical protein